MSERGQWLAATISAGAGESAAIDLGRSYEMLDVQLPAMDACILRLKVAEKLADTYYNLGEAATTSESTFNRADVWKLGGWRYIKVVSSSSQSTDNLIRVRGISQ